MMRSIDRALSGWPGGVILVLVLLVLAFLPAFLSPRSYVLYLLFSFFLFAVFGHAWNLLAGYCGLLSFGNQAFVGITGFTLSILHYYLNVDVWLALLLGGAVSALFAWLLAIPIDDRRQGRAALAPVAIAVGLWLLYEIAIASDPSLDIFGSAYVRRTLILLLIFLGALPLLRLRGAYFAVATWLIAASVASIFNEWKLAGAGGGMQIKSDVNLPELYYGALLLLVVSTAVIWRLMRSRYGLAFTAVRDDEEVAETVGVNVRFIKMLVLVLSGGLTGLAAGLYYMDSIIITPAGAFAVIWSAYFVFIVVVGGIGTIAGPIIGAAIYVVVDRLLDAYLNRGLLVLGTASIVMMFVMPRGIMGLLADLRTADKGSRFLIGPALQLLLGQSERKRTRGRRDQPGVVAAFLVTGSPLPLMRSDNPPWKVLVDGFKAARKALAAAEPDTLLVYSTQWVAVLDQLWQARPRISGLHVDENWHEFGNLRFDIRTDAALARDCVTACGKAGIKAKAVDYDGFPVDTGTIIAQNFLNPLGEIPLVVASNNIYHDFETTRRLGALAAAQAISHGKRVAVIGIGNLSGGTFRTDILETDDRILRDSDDQWNRDVLRKMREGRIAEVMADLPVYVREAQVDMGFKHFAWILGAVGGELRGAVVHAYGPAWGAGAAVIEFTLE
jgi:ABC-type branched-subunit amino acid transport system permease subunit/aromatic ring-opening dioxygenase catalytic subunit (LigB family)